MRAFYWRWLKTAFRHSLGAVDLWSFVIGSMLALIDHFWLQMHLMTKTWQIPVWVLGTIITGRLVLAPYWMWKEDEVLRPAPSKARTRLTELRAEGVAIRNRGQNLTQDLPAWLAEVRKWEEATIAAIKKIDEADGEWFRTLDTVPQPRIKVHALDKEHLKTFREIDYGLTRLDHLIQKYSSS